MLNKSEIPPFTIEDNTDGGDDLRMKFRYLDLRRPAVRKNLELRHKMAFEIRRYLDSKGFLEIETPILVKSTPEGARDFVVPSRMNPGEFYALPRARSFSSSYSWSAGSTVISRSRNASVMKTFVLIASRSSPDRLRDELCGAGRRNRDV